MSTDDSSFLNFASSGLEEPSPASDLAGDGGGSSFVRPPPPSGTLDDDAPSFDRPMPPSSTSMDDLGLLSQPPSRPTSAVRSDDEGARAMSAMSSEEGPDAQSTDFGLENSKNNAIGDDFFKKPVENMSLEEVGCPAMASAGAARAARPDPMSWVTLLYDYSQATTMHGLPYITASSRFAARRSALCRLLLNIFTQSLVALISITHRKWEPL